MCESMSSSQDIPILFSALDTVLSLHYATSITVPSVHDLCVKATQLTKKRIDTSTLELILTLDPQAYKIVHFGSRLVDYGVCTPNGISPLHFGTLLTTRRRAFERRVASSDFARLTLIKLSQISVPYLKTHTNKDLIEKLRDTGSSPRESKINSTTKKCVRENVSNLTCDSLTKNVSRSKVQLSNHLPTFVLKNPASSKGLSLIERIKRKESNKKNEMHKSKTEETRLLYIKSKAPSIYKVIYELSLQSKGEQKQYKTMTLEKLVSVVKDSFSYTMIDEEINDIIQTIAFLLPERLNIVHVGGIHAIKIFPLNRTLDLSILENMRQRE